MTVHVLIYLIEGIPQIEQTICCLNEISVRDHIIKIKTFWKKTVRRVEPK